MRQRDYNQIMNSISLANSLNLLKPIDVPAINQISGFCSLTKLLDPNELVTAYHRVRESAPHRHERNKRYFVGHSGVTSSGGYSNRREEHLAVALWNSSQAGCTFALPDGCTLEFLDYQFPLKARRGDKGVGKVDLFGVAGKSKPCVIELKIHPANTGMGDTPLRAFLEALAYCAIVEENAGDIAQEAFDKFGYEFTESRPTLIVLATEEYWSAYMNHPKAGNWWPELRRLADSLEKSIGLESYFIALRDADFSMGLEGQKPQLLRDCSLISLADLMS
jgi:hypothetical protein